MIKKIDIEKFGLFADYNWHLEVGNDPDKDTLKKVNIIYGRNYSGKTTLSRVFRCVEKQEMHKNYLDAKFQLTLVDNTSCNESNLICSKKIRVYNTDFVKENLSWLYNDEGDILPFTLLGGDNTIIEGKIKDINEKLGVLNPETNTYNEDTLYFKRNTQNKEVIDVNKIPGKQTNDLDSKLRNKAKEIKANVSLVKQATHYTITSIKDEINDIVSNNLNTVLAQSEKESKYSLLKEDEKKKIDHIPILELNVLDRITSVQKLVIDKITLTNQLQELINEDFLQQWVNNGRALHLDKTICTFCGGDISINRRKELDEHFSKESEQLENKLKEELNKLTSTRKYLETFMETHGIKKELLYSNFHSIFNDLFIKWEREQSKQIIQLTKLEELVQKRLKNVFKPLDNIDFSIFQNDILEFNKIITEFNEIITDNNNNTKLLDQNKAEAQKALRYDLLYQYIADIEYSSSLKTIQEAEKNAENANCIYERLVNEISGLEENKVTLEKELKDESRAAEKINKHLTDFFGHDSIQLEPYDASNEGEIRTRFVIKRGESEAKNLSEGECSLVAFCYFMAKIEDELQDPNAKDKLIIYIDDPISSLDNSHIFFMYSLIESITVGVSKENPKFCQLFISTHNLEFLKHLSNLHKFDNSATKNRANFVVEKSKKNVDSKSFLRRMPRYLRINISEYLYLFDEIYKLATIEELTENKVKYFEDNYTQLYAMGNIMRKFLECYMSTKYPHIDSPYQNLNLLFPNSIPRQINRLVQEYSHLQWGVRGALPIDVPEAEETAKKIIEALELHDPLHFRSLVNCLEKEDNA